MCNGIFVEFLGIFKVKYGSTHGIDQGTGDGNTPVTDRGGVGKKRAEGRTALLRFSHALFTAVVVPAKIGQLSFFSLLLFF